MTNELTKMTEEELIANLEEIGVYYDGSVLYNKKADRAELDKDICRSRLKSMILDSERILLATENKP